ncbi:XdhC family protein [Desulforamulus profundi]
MLVLPDGTCIGTIGGGCGEAAVRRDALMLFDEGGVKISSVLLDAGTAAEEGMVCGGAMDVFLERLV